MKILLHLKKVQARTLPIAVHTLQRVGNREAYQQKVTECLSAQPHDSEKSVGHNWETLKGCIVSAGETAVGCGKKKQPDWFLDAGDTLLEENAAHSQFYKLTVCQLRSSGDIRGL